MSTFVTAKCKFTNPSATHGSDKMITSQTVTENSTCSTGRNEQNATSLVYVDIIHTFAFDIKGPIQAKQS